MPNSKEIPNFAYLKTISSHKFQKGANLKNPNFREIPNSDVNSTHFRGNFEFWRPNEFEDQQFDAEQSEKKTIKKDWKSE